MPNGCDLGTLVDFTEKRIKFSEQNANHKKPSPFQVYENQLSRELYEVSKNDLTFESVDWESYQSFRYDIVWRAWLVAEIVARPNKKRIRRKSGKISKTANAGIAPCIASSNADSFKHLNRNLEETRA